MQLPQIAFFVYGTTILVVFHYSDLRYGWMLGWELLVLFLSIDLEVYSLIVLLDVAVVDLTKPPQTTS
jgi:hypothetical protein